MFGKTLQRIASLVLLAAAVTAAGATRALAAGAPAINKTTVIVRPDTTFVFDKKANHYNYGWLPLLDFTVNGPIASGSMIYVETTTPDGKPWVSFDCETKGIGEGETLKIDSCGRRAVPNEKMSMVPGLYGFKIKLKNELQGTNQTLFVGKAKADKVFYGDVPQDKDNYKWYVDYDWALPIAEVFSLATETLYGVVSEREAKPLLVSFWFRGEAGDAAAYLFYNGREIANTENTTGGGEQGVTLFDKQNVSVAWVKYRYTFNTVLVSNSENPDNHPDAFRMDKHPGEYEVKVLRKGKLARTVKFTVGADGKIVDNGISRQNELGTNRMTVFAAVTGDEDGRKPDLQAWKTTAFFGSPLKGFGQ